MLNNILYKITNFFIIGCTLLLINSCAYFRLKQLDKHNFSENNISRTTLQALAGVLGGTQSLHTNSMDETLALPSEKAVEIALRTQQLLAFETGVANVVDPLGGSWYVESLTDKMEKGVLLYLDDIDKNGGVIECIENGYFQKEIANSSSLSIVSSDSVFKEVFSSSSSFRDSVCFFNASLSSIGIR